MPYKDIESRRLNQRQWIANKRRVRDRQEQEQGIDKAGIKDRQGSGIDKVIYEYPPCPAGMGLSQWHYVCERNE